MASPVERLKIPIFYLMKGRRCKDHTVYIRWWINNYMQQRRQWNKWAAVLYRPETHWAFSDRVWEVEFTAPQINVVTVEVEKVQMRPWDDQHVTGRAVCRETGKFLKGGTQILGVMVEVAKILTEGPGLEAVVSEHFHTGPLLKHWRTKMWVHFRDTISPCFLIYSLFQGIAQTERINFVWQCGCHAGDIALWCSSWDWMKEGQHHFGKYPGLSQGDAAERLCCLCVTLLALPRRLSSGGSTPGPPHTHCSVPVSSPLIVLSVGRKLFCNNGGSFSMFAFF